jgi:hypothetical protein
VTCLVSMHAMEELAHFQLPGIVYSSLWHGACALSCWNMRWLCCVTKLHILEWPFIVHSTRCTCVMIILFNLLLYMIQLSTEICSLTATLTNMCTEFERNKISLVCIEHFWDLLFQLMKHGTNTLQVVFIFLFSIVRQTHISSTIKAWFYKPKHLGPVSKTQTKPSPGLKYIWISIVTCFLVHD